MSNTRTLTTLFTVTLSLVACRARDGGDDGEAAELAADSTQTANEEAALLSSLIDDTSASVAAITADDAAAAIAARAAQRYSPSGCVEVTQNGSNLALEFSGCTGPRGLRQLNGSLALVVSVGAGGAIVVDASANDFQIGGATLDLAATATYTGSGTTQSLAVTTRTAGVGGRGFEIAHDGDYTVTWDSTCVSLEGEWSTDRGDAQRSTTADVMRCIDQCPIGTVTRNTVRDRRIEITFDGSPTARWTSSAGGSGDFPLACGL
jgi:hypothetical protein